MKVASIPAGCFVVGTDTEVGKTFQAANLARNLAMRGVQVGVYKPVASGVVQPENSDAQLLREAAGLHCPLSRVCPQQFAMPLAPPVAAREEGREVDETLLIQGIDWWKDQCEYLIVEGAGGVLSPLSNSMTVLDFLVRTGLSFPVVIVAANRLGVVNHALLTLEALRGRGLPVAGILLNQLPDNRAEVDPSLASNLDLLRQFADRVPVESDAPEIWKILGFPMN